MLQVFPWSSGKQMLKASGFARSAMRATHLLSVCTKTMSPVFCGKGCASLSASP